MEGTQLTTSGPRTIIRQCERTGRPLGSPAFVKRLERKLVRSLLPQTPGRKPENGGEEHNEK